MKSSLSQTVQTMLENRLLFCQENSEIYEEKVYTVTSDPLYQNDTLSKYLIAFYRECSNLGLPTHNPVAFFDAIQNNLDALLEKREQLKFVMDCAAAGNGFVFGSAFLYMCIPDAHPCNFRAFSQDCEHLYARLYCIEKMAANRFAPFFQDELNWIQDSLTAPLNAGRQQFADWSPHEKHTSAADLPAFSSYSWESYQELWTIYRTYSLSQYLDGQELERNQQAKVFKQMEEISHILFDLDRFWIEIEGIQKRPDNAADKKDWLQRYSAYLKKIALSIKNFQSPFDEDLVTSLGLEEFIKIAKMKKILPDIKKNYPLWDEKLNLVHFTKTERKLLQQYSQHPIYQFFRGVTSVLSDEENANAGPFLLANFLMHDHNPVSPFIRKTFQIHQSYTTFQPNLCSQDKRSVRLQSCHQWLFRALCSWWSCYVPLSYSEELNYYLFQRCQRHILECPPFKPYRSPSTAAEIEVIIRPIPAMESIYQLEKHIDNLLWFDYPIFPQYSNSPLLESKFQQFYYSVAKEKAAKSKEWEIRRHLEKLVTRDIAEQYKELAFLHPCGIGMAAPPISWHIELATWLEKLIRSDELVSDYVEGDKDILYPGWPLTVQEVSDSIDWLPGRKIYPEHFQAYLSQVELTIQKLCCERLRKELLSEIVSLYRKVYLE